MTDLPRNLARRTFLTDLGRVTLGAVVLGPVLAGCSDDSDGEPVGSGAGDGDTDQDDGTAGGSGGTGGLTFERASFGFVSAYVLVRDGEAMVFDTGTGEDGVGAIGDALEAAGAGWDAVSTLLISHSHGDHAGGIEAAVAEAPAATLYGAMPDLDSFRDRADTAEAVVDGDILLGVRIVGTPGHTLGHISAYDEDTGLLLAGDAIVNGVTIGGTSGDGIEASPPEFTADMDQALASVRVMADLRPATIVFGHGEPVTEDAADQLATYAGTL